MKRTKQWWAALTKKERAELHWLERCNSEWAIRGGGGNLPDDCSECPRCSAPHIGIGLCPTCSLQLDSLIYKADKAVRHEKAEGDIPPGWKDILPGREITIKPIEQRIVKSK